MPRSSGPVRLPRLTQIVPTLCVGMQPGTLCVPFASWNAERPLRHSHAERGNDQPLPLPVRSNPDQ
ncbi:hypothetical protein DM828_03460 [Pseudomonas umsongensis]|nr:hypothetical protein [Pseudomonas umsongensis]